jgi:outer membrane protein assembly factor BamB
MRRLIYMTCVLALGCGGTTPPRPASGTDGPEAAGPEVALAGDSRPAGKEGSDWPGFLGPFGTSVSPEKGIIAPWPAEGLRVVWNKPVGTGYGMPSISRGRLYLLDRHGDHGRLTCMDHKTGAFIWKFEYPTEYEDYFGYNNGPRCSPVIDDDRVYIYGAEGMLHCVRAEDGKPVWKVDTKAEFGVVQNFFGVGSTPVVEGDLLIVQVGGSPPGSGEFPSYDQKGNGSGIVAFDKRTGKVRYRITDELASYAGPVLATIDGRRWCFVFARGGLVGFEPATGKVDFHFPWRARLLESVNASNPVVVGDHVFISETYGPGSALLRVKPGGYDVVWTDAARFRDKSMQCHWNTPIHHAGYLYGCSGRHPQNGELRCIELATGKVMWSEPGLTRTSLLMIDGHLLCLGEEGMLRLLKVNPNRYEEVSALHLHRVGKPAGDRERLNRDPYWAAPIVSHGLLYVRGEGRLLCLELIPAKRE